MNLKRPSSIVIIAVILTGLTVLGLGDAFLSVANAATEASRATEIISAMGNPSASTTITITMTAVPDE